MATPADLAAASEAVRAAKRELFDAERRFDAEHTPSNEASLIAAIRVAERRLAEANAKLRDVARSL